MIELLFSVFSLLYYKKKEGFSEGSFRSAEKLKTYQSPHPLVPAPPAEHCAVRGVTHAVSPVCFHSGACPWCSSFSGFDTKEMMWTHPCAPADCRLARLSCSPPSSLHSTTEVFVGSTFLACGVGPCGTVFQSGSALLLCGFFGMVSSFFPSPWKLDPIMSDCDLFLDNFGSPWEKFC